MMAAKLKKWKCTMYLGILTANWEAKFSRSMRATLVSASSVQAHVCESSTEDRGHDNYLRPAHN
jgi:hypothetical protein